MSNEVNFDIQAQEVDFDIMEGGPYTLPPASSDALGGVKADPKQASDTQPVRIDDDGKLWTATGGGGSATDVQINGTSVVSDGVADIPYAEAGNSASNGKFGLVKPYSASFYTNANGILMPAGVSDSAITGRYSAYIIQPSNIDKAVTAVLTDGKAPALSDAQKAAAQSWLGVSGGSDAWEVVSDVELTEALSQFSTTFDTPVKKARLTVWSKQNVSGWKTAIINNKTAFVFNSDTGTNRAITLTLDSTNENGYIIVDVMEYQNIANGINGGHSSKTFRDLAGISSGITKIGFSTAALFPVGAVVKLEVVR